jgi:hypothetical protein
LNPNMVLAFTRLGWCKLYAGSINEVIPLVEQAIRLSPRDPGIGGWYYLIGTVHLLQSRTDDAIVWLEKARSATPTVPLQRSRLASAYALRSETERAAAASAISYSGMASSHRRTRRSPEAGGRESFFQHRPPEGPSWCVVGRAEDPRAF